MQKIRLSLLTLLTIVLMLSAAGPAFASQYYISAKGDTLSGLAAQSGIDPALLMAANDLAGNDLPEGTLLVLPLEPLQPAIVQSGDTLWSIGREYGVGVADMLDCNESLDAERLYPGMTVYVPLPEEQSVVEGPMQAEYPAVAALASRGSALTWPVEGVISSRYGWRDTGFHYGLDIAADTGSPIKAALSGQVIEAGWKNNAYGYTVMVDHGNGLKTLYGHASALLVQDGERVRQGDSIALVGSTGNSTGPHLHFEVRVNNICTDPMEYLR